MPDYIDLHAHILPGLDDGADDIDESVMILQAAQDAGFGTIACTPHKIETIYDPDRKQIESALDELCSRIPAGSTCTLVAGAEYYLDDRFFTLLENNSLITIGGSKVLLVELPMMHLPPFADQYAFKIRLKGYVPLLAHPERYNDIIARPKRAAELVNMGFKLQANLGSFSGIYGRRIAKTAKNLAGHGLLSVVASDIHSMKYATDIYDKGIGVLRKVVGDSGVKELLITEPARLLDSDYGD